MDGADTKNLLVVDDEPLIRQALKLALETEYTVTTASSGEEALEIVQRDTFPVVILDLRMGGISGISTLRQLKMRDPDQNVIILTAFQSMESAIDAVNLGAFNYLTKPCDNRFLKQVVSEGFENYHKRKQRIEYFQKKLEGIHDTFFSTLCHQVNTPLNAILGFAKLLEVELTDPELRSWAQEIEKSGNFLHDVLMELIDYVDSSNKVGPHNKEFFSAGELTELFELEAEPNDVELFYHEDGMSFGSFYGPKHIVVLILKKLLKFISRHCRNIILGIRFSPFQDGKSGNLIFHFRVPSFPFDECGGDPTKFFEPYATGSSNFSDVPVGLGLELPTCRKLAEFASGSIKASHEEPRDLTFTLEVPAELA